MSLTTLETNCRHLSDLRLKLRRKFEARQQAINAVAAQHDAEIRQLQDDCAASRQTLLDNLALSRQWFTRPKTREFSGITVGFEKGRAKLTMPPEEILIDRIEKMLPPQQAETILHRSAVIIKNAFKKLDRDLLQKLGCSVVTGSDEAIVRANDDDIEALVHKSLGEATAVQSPAST